MEYDSSESGLRSVLFDWQEEAMNVLWSIKVANSRIVWETVNEKMKPQSISRASIINFLEEMRKQKILNGYDETGKGGHHWVYSAAMSESEFRKYIVEKIIGSLKRNFPQETEQVLKKY
jgi:predicted transcriptional regulator